MFMSNALLNATAALPPPGTGPSELEPSKSNGSPGLPPPADSQRNGGLLTQPVRLAGAQTVWTKEQRMLTVTVPVQFSKVQRFDLNEMEMLQGTVVGRGYATEMGSSNDRGRYLLLLRLEANALLPKEGWSHHSPRLAEYASSLSGGLAYQHSSLDALNGYLQSGDKAISQAFGSRGELSKSIAQTKSLISGLQKEADALLAKNARLIQSPALTEDQFHQRFGVRSP
jgi:hypothetical protein